MDETAPGGRLLPEIESGPASLPALLGPLRESRGLVASATEARMPDGAIVGRGGLLLTVADQGYIGLGVALRGPDPPKFACRAGRSEVLPQFSETSSAVRDLGGRHHQDDEEGNEQEVDHEQTGSLDVIGAGRRKVHDDLPGERRQDGNYGEHEQGQSV